MPIEARKYLFDIQQAIELIEGFCSGKSFPDYQQNPMLRSAVERQYRIVWGVIEGKLPQLRVEVKNLLAADTD